MKVIYFDTETTGLTCNDCQIIELAMITVIDGEKVEEYDKFIKVDGKLPPKITEITGISDQMLDEEGFDEDIIAEDLRKRLTPNTLMIAHNAQFDLNFLNAECENCSLPVTKNHAVDTLQLSRIIYPEAERHKLDFLADYLGIDKGSSHRAFDDAVTCMELFKCCMQRRS